MAIKTKELTVKNSEGKNIKIETSLYLGSHGLKIFSKLVSLVLPIILGSSEEKSKKSVLDGEVDFSKIANHLTTHLDEDTLLNLILDIVSITRVDNQDLSNSALFDQVFAGEYGLLIQTIQFVLEANFKSFFVRNGIENWLKMIPKEIKKSSKY